MPMIRTIIGRAMTVGELKVTLNGAADHLPVLLEVEREVDDGDGYFDTMRDEAELRDVMVDAERVVLVPKR